jgi:hypothetical protein
MRAAPVAMTLALLANKPCSPCLHDIFIVRRVLYMQSPTAEPIHARNLDEHREFRR